MPRKKPLAPVAPRAVPVLQGVNIEYADAIKEKLTRMKPLPAFEAGDGAHRGLYDFYEPKKIALLEALAKKAPFTTGWYGSKHEIASGRVTRVGERVLVEASVSDDFDTEGYGRCLLFLDHKLGAASNLSHLEKIISLVHDAAEENRKSNQVYRGFKVIANVRHERDPSCWKEYGRYYNSPAWIETYLKAIPTGFCLPPDKPPGDYYHKWGWQEESKKIPARVRKMLEKWALNYDPFGNVKSYRVAGFVISPWDQKDEA